MSQCRSTNTKRRRNPPLPRMSFQSPTGGAVMTLDHVPIEHKAEESTNMSEIIDGKLFLGDLGNATSLSTSNPHNIKRVITVGTGLEVGEAADGILYHRVEIEDDADADINAAFTNANVTIHDCLQKDEPVLVHCKRGISRSATIVIAYLAEHEIYPNLEECQDEVAKKRPQIAPNLGFQLWLQKKYSP